MRRTTPILALLAILTILCSLAGCGSGGSASNGVTVDSYVTDNFSDDYSHVQVTLYKIEASTDGQTFQTLYEDPNGHTLDLVSLKDAAQLLGSVSVPSGDLTQARVVFADHLVLTPKSGGASQNVPVEDHPPLVVSADGKSTVTLEAHTERASDKLSNLVIDFDLSAFALVSGHVRPSLRPGDPAQFQQKEHRAALAGVVSNLTSTGFDLTSPVGDRSIPVKVTDSTAISYVSNGANATLANGQNVLVQGKVDLASHTITADAVRIMDRPINQPPQGAIGTVASIDAANLRFDLNMRDGMHVQLTGDVLHVQTNGGTIFATPGRKAATFAEVRVDGVAAVLGTFDPATQTMTAQRVELVPMPMH